MRLPTFPDIKTAAERIDGFIHHTPVLTSRLLNDRFGCELYFKCENFQRVGAFKFRGATNAVLCLTDDEKKRGVVTHSSGNHAAALALAAGINGVKAYIVMPENAPAVKKNAVAGYGADITFCKPTQKDREETTGRIMEETGATLVHPYDNFNVICGQGTAALEMLRETGNLDIVVAPVGGGGLMSGTSVSVRGIDPGAQIFGAEPLNADDACRSLATGIIQPSISPVTMADGLLTSLSELTFEVIKRNVNGILTVTEDSIKECMLLIWERMKIVVEPSSATVLAAVLENPETFRGRRAGLILSGGNVDFRSLKL